MLYEAVIRTPCVDVYGKHKFIERQFKERGVATRRYTWTPSEGRMAIVRYFEPLGDGFTWLPLESPPANKKIRFHLCAHVRRFTDLQRSCGNGFRRISNSDYCDNLQWIEDKSALIGLRLVTESIDVNPVTIPIFGKKTQDGTAFIKPFRLVASQFDGVAIVDDPNRFSKALALSVGNAKAFGLGFIMFSVFGRGTQQNG
jgi:hypothetical protein